MEPVTCCLRFLKSMRHSSARRHLRTSQHNPSASKRGLRQPWPIEAPDASASTPLKIVLVSWVRPAYRLHSRAVHSLLCLLEAERYPPPECTARVHVDFRLLPGLLPHRMAQAEFALSVGSAPTEA